jgi:RimJ/RimL family protein N-acetyltransferase
MGAGEGWWEDEHDPGACGVDRFSGHPHCLDQGLGTAMLRSFLALMFDEPEVTLIQADPPPNNHRAIRCYAKAGFAMVARVVTPHGPALPM